jgi:cytidine deaminase
LNNDKIISGANQENAVFPLGLCAERVAIFSALSQFSDIGIRAIAIKTEKVLGDGELPGFPCGSCRQSMVEMEARFDQQMKVFVFGRDERVYVLTSAKDLLPFAFDQKAL